MKIPLTIWCVAGVLCANAGQPAGAALLEAAARGDRDQIRRLLAAGADAAAVGPKGVTPLMNAARSGDLPSVRLLLEAGARVRVWDADGLSARDLAPAGNLALRDELSRQRAKEIKEVPPVLPAPGISLTAMRRMVAGPALANAQAISRIRKTLAFLFGRWSAMRNPQAAPASPVAQDAFARSLGRDLYALDLALFSADGKLLDAIAADLGTKAADCAARPEGLGGDVKVTIRTVSTRGEVKGWKLTYVERFLWDLRDKIASFDTQWHECARLSAAVDEPIPAGNYAVVAISPDARRSQPKMIEVAVPRPATFEVLVP